MPWANHLIATAQATHATVTNADQESLVGHGGVTQHPMHGFGQRNNGQVQRFGHAVQTLDVAFHAWGFTQNHIHRHVNRTLLDALGGVHFVHARQAFAESHAQLALFSRHTHDGKGAALALSNALKTRQILGQNGQDVTLLGFVGPDFSRRQTRLFQRNASQFKNSATLGIVHQFRECVG